MLPDYELRGRCEWCQAGLYVRTMTLQHGICLHFTAGPTCGCTVPEFTPRLETEVTTEPGREVPDSYAMTLYERSCVLIGNERQRWIEHLETR